MNLSNPLRRLILVTVALFCLDSADAQSLQYQVLIDADRDASTGCTIVPTGEAPLSGFEHRILASVDASNQQVTAVEQQDCNGATFDAPVAITLFSVPWPVGLNNGTLGSDVIELAVPLADIEPPFGTSLRLVFIASNADGSDVLATVDGADNGTPIVLSLPIDPVQIPIFSTTGLIVLLFIMILIGWLGHRRLGRYGAMSAVLLVAGVAWAMNFIPDGNPNEWVDIPPAGEDPDGDSSDGSGNNDILAAFLALHGNNLFFRFDVSDIENQTPEANDDLYTTDEDTPLSEAAPGVLDNDFDAESDPITAVLDAGPTNAASFTLNADGSFDYTPDIDFNGSDSFTYVANDGQTNSAAATVTITVNPINDAPSFTAGGNVSSAEDAGPQTVVGWASSVSAGPANESGQSLSFNITNNTDPALFETGPAVDPSTGNLTYTAAANTNGSATISLTLSDDGGTANGGIDTSSVTTFAITINEVSDSPTITAIADQTIAEDGTTGPLAFTVDDEDTTASALTVTATSSDQSLIPDANLVLGGSDANRTVTATPVADGNGGPVTITVTVDDGEAAPATETFTVTVTPVNDAPTFTGGGNVSSGEDAGAQSVAGWATAISPGPANESGQFLSFNVTDNDNSALFSAGPAVDPATGNLTYTAATDASGSATISITLSDDGGTTNSGTDTSTAVNFTITVNAVNDAPSFTAGSNVSSDEDAGAQTVAGWASNISAGPSDESGQALSFNITGNDNSALFSAGPAVDPATGSLTYTAATNTNGSATISLTLSDDGGTTNGGTNTSTAVNFTITVNAINDAPSFTAGSNISSDEDAGPQTIAGWASNISAGPSDESGQLLSFNIASNTNAALFSAAPAVDPTTGNLTYTAATDASGSATISITLSDDGGTANGGTDTSSTTIFTITVSAVDDLPTAMNDSASVTEDDSATSIDVLGNDTDNDGGPMSIASVTQPANGTVVITNAGTDLTYAPDANYCNEGSPTDDFTYTLNGGSIGTVAMRVGCVNDLPVADDETVAVACNIEHVVETSPFQTAVGTRDVFRTISDNVLVGDSDPVEGSTVSIVEVSSSGGGTKDGTAPFEITTSQGGSLTLHADGSFKYTPDAGDRSIADNFIYSIEDADGGRDQGTVTLNIGSTCVWFVDNSNNGGADDTGSGTSSDPLTSLVDEIGSDTDADDAEDASQASDVIYVLEGDSSSGDAYLGGLVAKNGQKLLGEGVDLVLDLGSGPETLFTGNSANRPLIDTAGAGIIVTNVTGVEVAGLQIRAATAIEATSSNTPLGLTVRDNAIFGDADFGIDVNGTNTAGTSTILLSDNEITSTDDGINVAQTGVGGAIDLSLGAHTITSTANDGIDLSGVVNGELRVVALGDLTVSGSTAGRGFAANQVTFDAAPSDGDFTGDTVTTGNWAIGTNGDPIGEDAVVLTAVSGDLAFGDLDIFATRIGLDASGFAAFNANTGTGFRIASSTGSNISGSTGILLSTLSADVALDNIIATSGGFGVRLGSVAGSFSATSGNLTNQTSSSFTINGGSVTASFGGSITQGASGQAVSIDSMTGGSVTFSGAISATAGTGIQVINNTNTLPVNFNSTVDLGTIGNRISSGTALQLSGNSAGTSVTFTDLDIFTSSQTGIDADNSGTLSITTGSIDASAGVALDLNTMTSNVTLSSLISSNSAGSGASLVNVPGSVSITNGSITSFSTGAAFNVSGGAATVSYGGAISNSAGRLVNVESKASGGVTFSGALGDTGGQGIRLINNDATVSFTGTVDITDSTDNAVSLNGGTGVTSFADLDIANTTSNQRGILANSAGTLNITTGNVNVTGAQAFSASSIGLGVTLATLTSSNSNSNGINIDTATGSLTFTGTVDVTNSASQGVRINSAPAFSTSFADLDVTNITSNQTGLFAGTAGTLTITTGTLNGGTAAAVDIDNTALAVTLVSASSSGGNAPGIDLNTTTGFFTVNGDGANTAQGGNGSGGTIQNKGGGNSTTTGIGVLLNNASNVTLRRMQLNDHANWALYGTSVNGLVLQYTTINGVNGNDAGPDEGAVYLNNLTGTALAGSNPTQFDNVDIEGGLEDNVRINLSAGTLADFQLINSRIGLNSNALGNDGVLINVTGTANGTFLVNNNTLVGARGDMFQLSAGDTSVATVTLSGNRAQNTHGNIVSGGGGITISGGGGGSSPTLNYTVSGNTITDAVGNALTINKGTGGGTYSGSVTGNTIGVSGNTTRGSSQAAGLRVVSNGSGRLSADLQNNQVYGYNEDGISAEARDGSSQLALTLQGNTIANPGGLAINGIYIEAAPSVSDTVEVCVTFGGAGAAANSFVGSNGGFDEDFRIRQRNNGVVNVIGYADGPTDPAAVVNYVQGQNTGTPTGRVDIASVIGGTCSF